MTAPIAVGPAGRNSYGHVLQKQRIRANPSLILSLDERRRLKTAAVRVRP